MSQASQITLRVPDMNCGHCAGTITQAVENGVPGARVVADPATKLVSVDGASDAGCGQGADQGRGLYAGRRLSLARRVLDRGLLQRPQMQAGGAGDAGLDRPVIARRPRGPAA